MRKFVKNILTGTTMLMLSVAVVIPSNAQEYNIDANKDIYSVAGAYDKYYSAPTNLKWDVAGGTLAVSFDEVKESSNQLYNVKILKGEEEIASKLYKYSDIAKDTTFCRLNIEQKGSGVYKIAVQTSEDSVYGTYGASEWAYSEEFVFNDPLKKLEAPQNINWTGEKLVWDKVPNAAEYKYSLYGTSYNSIVEGVTSATEIDFKQYITQTGKYYAYVSALSNNINEVKCSDSGRSPDYYKDGWIESSGKSYWYEGGVKQGTYDDKQGVIGDGTVRGREIYDPTSDGWYWLDACYEGAKAISKEVWMPYIYQNEASWDDAEIEMNANNSGDMKNQVIETIKEKSGKWVRYDANGKMYKGWYTVEGSDIKLYPSQAGNTYYYDKQTGLMAKGTVNIDGKEYKFDEITGALIKDTPKPEVIPNDTIKKPSKISIWCDGSVITAANEASAFYDQLSAYTGIELEWTRPDHSGYVSVINNLFVSSKDLPDVVLLSYYDYVKYAKLGYLWNMTNSWNNSEVKNSGRLTNNAEDIFTGNMVAGKDGNKGLYGFTAQQGNGCITYIKQSWIDAANIKTLPKTFDEYYDMLLKMKKATGKAPIAASGFIGGEAPYTLYLPEFYQDAYPEFYEKDGVWVDGFTEEAMKNALSRLATAYKDGVFVSDIDVLSTSDCRAMFQDNTTGVISYWAGTWRNTLLNNIKKYSSYSGVDNEKLVVLEPIAEVGAYLIRNTSLWCITLACNNPEGVFNYFIQTMLDGGEGQMLWEYGAKDVHYSYDGTTFKQPELKSTGRAVTKNHFDGLLKLGEYRADYNNGIDVGMVNTAVEAIEAQKIFNNNSKLQPGLVITEAYSNYSPKIWTTRKNVINQVATGKMTVDEGMKYYQKNVEDEVKEILDSLNKK